MVLDKGDAFSSQKTETAHTGGVVLT
jgi:hypothetical protein